MSRTVIVGSSVAGVRTATGLRREGYTGEIVLVGEELELPYDKPQLSKGVLDGSLPEADNGLITAAAAALADIELQLGHRAESLDTTAHRVLLDDGSAIDYDTLVIATGTRARPSPWGTPEGLHELRTLDDSRALRRDLAAGGHLVVIGGGFIGSEVASSARTLGLTVEIVDPQPVPMLRKVGAEVGTAIGDLHTRHGVSARFGVGVRSVTQDDSTPAQLGRPTLVVTLADGTELRADSVVVGIGALTNHEWLEGSGLRLEDGVVCDEFLRATDVDDVHAVGDIARWWHPRHGEHVRLEHWTTAVEQAQIVAHNIARPAEPRAFAGTEYVWSDQYGSRLQFTGRTGGARQLVVRDPDEPNRFAALYSDDDVHFSGAVTVDWPRALIVTRRLVGTDVTLDDAHHAVEQLLPAAQAASAG